MTIMTQISGIEALLKDKKDMIDRFQAIDPERLSLGTRLKIDMLSDDFEGVLRVIAFQCEQLNRKLVKIEREITR